MLKRLWLLAGLALVVIAGLGVLYQGNSWQADAQSMTGHGVAGTYSYAIKFVCGFTSSNSELDQPNFGENVVKLGNYATDINIYNPALDPAKKAWISKKLVVLANAETKTVIREPEFRDAQPIDQFSLNLPGMAATSDDCAVVYRSQGLNPVTPPPLMVGWLILQSSRELDVTAVYTAEICSDWVFNPQGSNFMCSNPDTGSFGAGISIDVETIPGRLVTD